jgi:transposase
MTKENKKLDFSNQNFWIGIDVHKKNWKVTVRNSGRELQTYSMDPSPKQLSEHMNRKYPQGIYNSCYEAGFCGFWIDEALKSYGINNIVINPADVPTTHKEKTTKTDKIDSRKLARELENGSLKGIYVPNKYQQELRSLSRLRSTLVKEQTRIKNRIKGHLFFYGKKTIIDNRYWSKRYINELREMEFSSSLGKEYLNIYLEELESMRDKNAKLLKMLRKISREDQECKIIRIMEKSVPGIGFISAFTLFAEIMDMSRFPTMEHTACFVGLVPSLDSSGQKENTKGITSRKNKYLRPILVEAAWAAIKKDPALLQYYSKLLSRMNSKRALISVARKLLSRIRYVWLHQTEYRLRHVA